MNNYTVSINEAAGSKGGELIMTAQQIANGLGLRKVLAIECRKLIETTKKAST